MAGQAPFLQPLRVVEEQLFFRYDRQLRDLLALYFGALLILALWHLSHFLATKERAHLLLSLFITFWGMGQLSGSQGILKDYLTIRLTNALVNFAPLLKVAALFFAILFGRIMIQSARHNRRLRARLIGATTLILTGLLLSLGLTRLALIPLALPTCLWHICFVTALFMLSRGLSHHSIDLSRAGEQAAERELLNVRNTLQTQQDVAQAQKMEALERLVGGISHDFKNLLTPLYGYAELIQQHAKAESERIVAYTDKLMGSIKHIRDYGTNLLRFSPKQDAQCEAVDVEGVINQAIERLRQLNIKEATITTRFNVHRTPIVGERSLIEDALLNLGRNGCEALGQKGGTIVFETGLILLEQGSSLCRQLALPGGDYCTITITDSGCGMSPQVMHHLFEPFFTTKPRGQGAGLGMASVWGCMKSHHGAISVHSTPGQGSSFTLYFPLHPPQHSAPPPPQA
jgi:signal transduction histidine kinase